MGQHYLVKEWPKRLGQHNVKVTLLVDHRPVIYPPLRMKLELIKNIFKELDKDEVGLQYLSQISAAELKEGILIGPHIRKSHLTMNLI